MQLRPIALAVTLALAAAGAQAAVSGGVVKIGVLTDLSGTYADLAGSGAVLATQMAIDDFIAKEKPSFKVEMLTADHQNKADIASNKAREWFEREGVDTATELVTTSVALGVMKVAKEKNRIALISGAASTPITNEQCNDVTVHYTYDTYALANGTAKAVTQQGGKKWFFLTADYAFGHSLEENTAKVVEANGGEVVGTVDVPFPAQDFSSFLLQAQGSGADVIGLANAGGDTVNAIKQASEFGITQAGQKLAALLFFITDVHALGVQTAQGLSLTSAFYWDQNDQTREWSKRFMDKHGAEPTMVQAGVYSATMAYLAAVEALGSADDGKAVVAKMKEMDIDDPLFGKVKVRGDGRAVHDMYLYEVKTPGDSTGEWDLYKQISSISGDDAFLPMLDECDFTKK